MSSSARRKGSAFEVSIRDYLKVSWSDDIERLPLSGAKDRGDIANFRVGAGRHLVAWELKNRSQLALSQWVREAQAEAETYGAVAGVTCFKRKGKGDPGEQYVVMTVRSFLDILHAAS